MHACTRGAGVGVTNGLAQVRQMLDPTWTPANKAQDVLTTSVAYGTYMSVSSNLRYQVVAGEALGLPVSSNLRYQVVADEALGPSVSSHVRTRWWQVRRWGQVIVNGGEEQDWLLFTGRGWLKIGHSW